MIVHVFTILYFSSLSKSLFATLSFLKGYNTRLGHIFNFLINMSIYMHSDVIQLGNNNAVTLKGYSILCELKSELKY